MFPDCCECTCDGDGCDSYFAGFHCIDPHAPCFGVHHQQMKVQENDHTFKVTRFEGGRNTPFRIYFWNEALTGSSYRFSVNGDIMYFKAGSEVYYDVSHGGGDGPIEFRKKAESGGGGKPHGDDYHNADDPVEDSRQEFGCYQCIEAVSAVCGDGWEHPGGLFKFCDTVDTSALGSDGALSVEILCGSAHNTCSKAVGVCASACGVGECCRRGVA